MIADFVPPNILSSQVSASISSATPEPNQVTNDKIAIIIDYSTFEMEARHECKCGYILSDQI